MYKIYQSGLISLLLIFLIASPVYSVTYIGSNNPGNVVAVEGSIDDIAFDVTFTDLDPIWVQYEYSFALGEPALFLDINNQTGKAWTNFSITMNGILLSPSTLGSGQDIQPVTGTNTSSVFDFGTNTATFYYDPPETVGLYDGRYAMNSPLGGVLSGGDIVTLTFQPGVASVPVPAATWLFGAGLLGLISVAKRKKG